METVEYLNNTYPTTVLRKDLQTKEDQPNRERHSSTNELCPSHFHRMGSQDYDVSIGNEYVDIGEARHSQGHESPIQRGDKVRVRYSDSSTDSGEFKLGFETKTVVSEK